MYISDYVSMSVSVLCLCSTQMPEEGDRYSRTGNTNDCEQPCRCFWPLSHRSSPQTILKAIQLKDKIKNTSLFLRTLSAFYQQFGSQCLQVDKCRKGTCMLDHLKLLHSLFEILTPQVLVFQSIPQYIQTHLFFFFFLHFLFLHFFIFT